MTTTPASAAPETGETEQPKPAAKTTTDTTDTKPTDTVEFWKAQARENEKRAKANAEAAAKLAELEESQKTEAQRLADAAAAAKSEAEQAKAEALRWRVAARHGISDEDAELFLTGADEETLTKQAERLAAAVADQSKPRSPRPDPTQGRSSSSAGATTAEQFAATVGELI